MARSGGEAEETIYGGHLAENVDAGHEPHLLAPEAYDGCAGLTSKEIGSRNVDLAIHQSNLAVGKKHITTEHEAGRAKGNYGLSGLWAERPESPPTAPGGAYSGAAGLTSKQIFHLDSHIEVRSPSPHPP